MKKAAIAVMVSGGGTNLQALIDAQAAGKIPSGEIRLVIADNPGAYALQRAASAGIESVVITKKGRSAAEFEADVHAAMASHEIDLIVLAGFMSILSADFTSHYPHRMINIHPSLIPSFCGKGFYGLHVHEAALAKGVKVTGATVHFVNEIPDGGEIILQKAVNVHAGDTPERLQKRVMRQAEWKILPQAAELVSAQLISEKTEA